MAITGSGTLTDPYLVHDYWELKTACTNYDTYAGTFVSGQSGKYIALANDIDCCSEAYPDGFEWETITIGKRVEDWDTMVYIETRRRNITESEYETVVKDTLRSAFASMGMDIDAEVAKCGSMSAFITKYKISTQYPISLNLNKHSITRVTIKNNNCLFAGTYCEKYPSTKISNGKISNIFGNQARALIDGPNIPANTVGSVATFERVAVSVDGSGFTSSTFSRCAITYSSIYYKSKGLTASPITMSLISSWDKLLYASDLYFDITGTASSNHDRLINWIGSTIYIQFCRIHGKVSHAPTVWGLYNCVFNLKYPTRDNNADYVGAGSALHTLVNTSNVNVDYHDYEYDPDDAPVLCTNTEIKKADVLTTKGFTVIDVTPKPI